MSEYKAKPGSARYAAIMASVTLGVLDRELLKGLGLSADSADIVMSHIEELREKLKQINRMTLRNKAN